jgi:dTDP-4-amino-4,6-dideoxygalactose transaminase
MRDHGQARRYYHDNVGYNYRMDGFQGAVLRVKLKRLPDWTRKRQQFAAQYRQLLAKARVELPADNPQDESVYHLFVVYVDNRDAVRAELEKRGVQSAIHYPVPVHLQKAYAPLGYKLGSLPNTERACDRVFSMPLFPEMTAEHVECAAKALADIVGAR